MKLAFANAIAVVLSMAIEGEAAQAAERQVTKHHHCFLSLVAVQRTSEFVMQKVRGETIWGEICEQQPVLISPSLLHLLPFSSEDRRPGGQNGGS